MGSLHQDLSCSRRVAEKREELLCCFAAVVKSCCFEERRSEGMLTLDIALSSVFQFHLRVSTPFACWTLFFTSWMKYGRGDDARSFSFLGWMLICGTIVGGIM